MVNSAEFPFNAETPGNVPLESSSLVNVLAQVRFPVQSVFVSDQDKIARGIAAALAAEYPLFEEGNEFAMTITPEGGVQQAPTAVRLWRLASADGSWRVSFSQSFLSVETTAYMRRSDFTARLADAWEVFVAHVHPAFVVRLGTRYINRLDKPEHLAQLRDFVRPEVFGALGTSNEYADLMSGVSEAAYRHADGSTVHARWGLLSEGTTFDPTVPPATTPSWVLDCDASRTWAPNEQGPQDLLAQADGLALHAYEFFRWAMTPQYLSAFGGEV